MDRSERVLQELKEKIIQMKAENSIYQETITSLLNGKISDKRKNDVALSLLLPRDKIQKYEIASITWQNDWASINGYASAGEYEMQIVRSCRTEDGWTSYQIFLTHKHKKSIYTEWTESWVGDKTDTDAVIYGCPWIFFDKDATIVLTYDTSLWVHFVLHDQ